MRTNNSVQAIPQVLMLTIALTGWQTGASFGQGITAKTFNATGSIAQNGNEPDRCRKSVRLRSQELLNLVEKQTPIAPPAMLHDSKLHGKVRVEVSIDEAGSVIAVRGVKGHPFALSSAVESVRSWSFRPYKHNGEARCAIGLITLDYDFRSEASKQ